MCIICRKEYDSNTTSINCLGCKKIESIPYLPKLTTLYIAYTNIKKIPFFDKLQILYCEYTQIEEIPHLPDLFELYCGNTQIKKIPFFPNLNILSCTNTRITDIPYLPKLFRLFCSFTDIKILRYYPNLMMLDCHDCRLLSRVDIPRHRFIATSYNETFKNCIWLNVSEQNLEKVEIIQYFFRKFLKRKHDKIRMLLIKHTYPDIINTIMKY